MDGTNREAEAEAEVEAGAEAELTRSRRRRTRETGSISRRSIELALEAESGHSDSESRSRLGVAPSAAGLSPASKALAELGAALEVAGEEARRTSGTGAADTVDDSGSLGGYFAGGRGGGGGGGDASAGSGLGSRLMLDQDSSRLGDRSAVPQPGNNRVRRPISGNRGDTSARRAAAAEHRAEAVSERLNRLRGDLSGMGLSFGSGGGQGGGSVVGGIENTSSGSERRLVMAPPR